MYRSDQIILIMLCCRAQIAGYASLCNADILQILQLTTVGSMLHANVSRSRSLLLALSFSLSLSPSHSLTLSLSLSLTLSPSHAFSPSY